VRAQAQCNPCAGDPPPPLASRSVCARRRSATHAQPIHPLASRGMHARKRSATHPQASLLDCPFPIPPRQPRFLRGRPRPQWLGRRLPLPGLQPVGRVRRLRRLGVPRTTLVVRKRLFLPRDSGARFSGAKSSDRTAISRAERSEPESGVGSREQLCRLLPTLDPVFFWPARLGQGAKIIASRPSRV